MKTCIYIYNVNVLCMYIWSSRCPFLEPLPRAARNAGAAQPQGLPGRRGPFKGAGRGGRGSATWPLIGWRDECRPHDSEGGGGEGSSGAADWLSPRSACGPFKGAKRPLPGAVGLWSPEVLELLRVWGFSGSGAAGTGPAGLCQEGSRPRGRAPRPSG